MTIVVLGLDALDPDLVDPEEHRHLVLDVHDRIDTIESEVGEPATHELWPTIITGLPPEEHGLLLGEGGVGWADPVLATGARVADHVLPDSLQAKIGAWILNNTNRDAFRTSSTYYTNRGLSTLFDNRVAKPIGIPNYVVDPDDEDREHQLRQRLGAYLDFDPGAETTHTTEDPGEFYERCLEMVMVRIARVRRALRGGRFELVFGYTSGLDLVGHVAYDLPEMQRAAYDEINGLVGEIRSDLGPADELLLVSDHGLQDGVHTDEAMVAATTPDLVDPIDSVLTVRAAIETTLDAGNHTPDPRKWRDRSDTDQGEAVREQLEDLGYM